MWALSGLVSIALGVVLFIRPDIGAFSLATVFGLFSIVYGVSALVLSFQARDVDDAAQTAGGLRRLTERRQPTSPSEEVGRCCPGGV
jgi:uncharacterized membrane protein HdeD (DUF308 family)